MKIFFGKDRRKAWANLRQRCVGGITYIFPPAIIAIMKNIFSATGEIWRLSLKRKKKQELPFGGNPFRRIFELNDGHTLLSGGWSKGCLGNILGAHTRRTEKIQRHEQERRGPNKILSSFLASNSARFLQMPCGLYQDT